MTQESEQTDLTFDEMIAASEYEKDELTPPVLEELLEEFGDQIDRREIYVKAYGDTTAKVHVGECVPTGDGIDVEFQHTGTFNFDTGEYHYDGVIPRLENRFELIAERWENKSGANRHRPALFNYKPEVYIDFIDLMDLYNDGLYAIKIIESREDDIQPEEQLRQKAKFDRKMEKTKLSVAIRQNGGIDDIPIELLQNAVEKYDITQEIPLSPSSDTLRQDVEDRYVKSPLQPLSD